MSLYNETHDLGRFFWHSISLKRKSALIHMCKSHEMEEPHRYSNSLIFRKPFSEDGIVVGFWRNVERTEDEAILAALGRQMGLEEFSEAKSTIRRDMMRKQYPADHQALIVEALDL